MVIHSEFCSFNGLPDSVGATTSWLTLVEQEPTTSYQEMEEQVAPTSFQVPPPLPELVTTSWQVALEQQVLATTSWQVTQVATTSCPLLHSTPRPWPTGMVNNTIFFLYSRLKIVDLHGGQINDSSLGMALFSSIPFSDTFVSFSSTEGF